MASKKGGLRSLIDYDVLSMGKDITDHLAYMDSEGDRSVLILLPALLESIIVNILKSEFSHLNKDEIASLFDVDGMAGTFASRVRLAYVFKIIDRPTKRIIDRVREIRNTAAHAQTPVTFAVKEVQDVIYGLFPNNLMQSQETLGAAGAKIVFKLSVTVLIFRVIHWKSVNREIDDILKASIKAWLDSIMHPDIPFEPAAWVINYMKG